MHNLLRCRRGSAAFVTVIALVPLIGVVAVGGEAGRDLRRATPAGVTGGVTD
jgi:hypothetical protein